MQNIFRTPSHRFIQKTRRSWIMGEDVGANLASPVILN